MADSLMNPPRDARDREHKRAKAVRSLVAAAALMDFPSRENMAEALIHCGIAMLCIAGRDLAVAALRERQVDRACGQAPT